MARQYRPALKHNCGFCGTEFLRQQCRTDPRNRLFCSHTCHIQDMKKRAFRLQCIICSKTFFCQPIQVKLRDRKTCSRACQSALQTKRAEQSRIDNPPTQGALNRRIRYSKKMKDWREAVFKRDNYTCQFCKVRGGYLQADHIKPFALYPDLRFDLDNGRTLCRPCHYKTPTHGRPKKSLLRQPEAQTR